MLSIGLFTSFLVLVFKLHLPFLNFSSKNLCLWKFFLQFGNFSEVSLTSFVRLLLFSALPLCNYKIFFSGFFSSSFYLFPGFFFTDPRRTFLSLTFFLLYSSDSDVRYTRLFFYSRRSNLIVLRSVPPFLKLWGNSLSFCWSVPLFLNFSPHIYIKYIFIYLLDYVVFFISYLEIIITRQFWFVNTFFQKNYNFFHVFLLLFV